MKLGEGVVIVDDKSQGNMSLLWVMCGYMFYLIVSAISNNAGYKRTNGVYRVSFL